MMSYERLIVTVINNSVIIAFNGWIIPYHIKKALIFSSKVSGVLIIPFVYFQARWLVVCYSHVLGLEAVHIYTYGNISILTHLL